MSIPTAPARCDERLEKALREVMDLSPRGIRRISTSTSRSTPRRPPTAISAASRVRRRVLLGEDQPARNRASKSASAAASICCIARRSSRKPASSASSPSSIRWRSSCPPAEDAGVTNVRLHDDDATQLLDWLPDACLDGIDLLYPDPWPKKKHWKRRFVNEANLDRFARVLQAGRAVPFRLRHRHLCQLDAPAHSRPSGFEWPARNASDWRTPYEGWPGTRYEAKA
jgi:hypothetical protein